LKFDIGALGHLYSGKAKEQNYRKTKELMLFMARNLVLYRIA